MSLSVDQADKRSWLEKLLFGWGHWRPEPCPDLPVLSRWDGPWRRAVHAAPIDVDRSAALIDVDVEFRARAGGKPWEGVSYGLPINAADHTRSLTPVRNLAKGTVSWLPLPAVLRRGGDPAGAFDRHMRLVDEATMQCWEAIWAQPLGDGTVNVGYASGSTGMIVWDMSQRWDPATAPRGGVIAASVPHTPLIARFDEVLSGRIDHTLAIVLPNYSSEPAVGWARSTDGMDRTGRSPLRAGDIVRLSCVEYVRFCQRFEPGTPERVLVTALWEFGAVVVDKSAEGDPAKGVASIALTQDPRWADLAPLGIRLAMCEVVQPVTY